MNKVYFAFGLLVFCLFSVTGQNKEERKAIVETISVNDSRLAEFFLQSNADSIAGMFSPNSHLMMEYQELIEKRENIVKHFEGLFKSGTNYKEFKLEADEHKVYDDLVLEIGENQVKYSTGKDSKTFTKKYNYMLIWKKSKGGKYQIRAASWNPIENPCK